MTKETHLNAQTVSPFDLKQFYPRAPASAQANRDALWESLKQVQCMLTRNQYEEVDLWIDLLLHLKNRLCGIPQKMFHLWNVVNSMVQGRLGQAERIRDKHCSRADDY